MARRTDPEGEAPARPGRGRLSAHGKDRREDIVKQAKVLFGENGYAETRMTDIAEAVGITKGLLYWYFDSKEALIAEILADLRASLRAVQQEAVSGIDDPLGRIYVATAASVRFVVDNFRLYSWMAFAGSDVIGAESAQSIAVHTRDSAANIAEGQRLGIIRDDDDATELALAGTGTVDRLCLLAHRGHIKGGGNGAARVAARYVVRSLAVSAEVADAIEAKYAVSGGRAPARGAARRR